ncbi:MAG: CDP-alcohol phosphatidyltransferase family protein [Kiloniellales bacterium]
MSHNTWIHKVVRVGVRPLARTAVTPNQVTTLRLLAGFAAAAAFAIDSDGWRDLGAGLFLISLFLDRADGELARLSGRTSSGGHKYDLWSDAVANAAAFIGLGIGLAGGPLGGWAIPLGCLAGAAVAGVLLMVVRLERAKGERAGELAGAAGFDPDDGMLAVPLLVWLGLADWLLVAAAVGAPSFACLAFLKLRGRLGGGAGEAG